MKGFLITHPKLWLVTSLVVLLLVVASIGADKTSAHRPYPTATRTPTSTPTLTPTPVLKSCQITAIIFDRFTYTPNDPIKVTIRLADFRGTPLIGANVLVEVTPDPPSVQLSTGFGLIDRSGDYEGVFGPFPEGVYRFKFTATDPTDQRFLPCLAEEEVPVGPARKLSIDNVQFDQNQYAIGETIILTATVTANGEPFTTAEVTASVKKPDGSTDGIKLDHIGNGRYRSEYSETDTPGDYRFVVKATDPGGQWADADPKETIVPVVPCGLSIDNVQFDQNQYAIGETIILTATVTANGEPFTTAEVTASVKKPDGSTDGIKLDHIGNGRYRKEYKPDQVGDYTFEVTATDPSGQCTPDVVQTPPVRVDRPTEEPVVIVVPEVLTTTLCEMTETTAINAKNVPSRFERIRLEISYDPRVIQVIDANLAQIGVQVRPGSLFATGVIRNEVDWRRGRIFFEAQLLDSDSPLNFGVIAIDWRPQNVGTSPVTLVEATLFDRDEQPIEANEPKSGTVNVKFVPDCRNGTVALQGRRDHSGVIVANSAGQTVQTGADGYFAIEGGDRLSFEMAGYLSAEADLRQILAARQADDDEPVNLGTIRMQAGDVNDDDRVDILDLAYVASKYLSVDPLADLNTDGSVNILDLALVASNHDQEGPVSVGP